MYAIIKRGSHQYKVSQGDVIDFYSFPSKEGEKISVSDVLLTVDGEKVQVGEPLVNNAKVLLTVIKHHKGDKIDVAKFKAKSKYRRKIGFRPRYTQLKVESITTK